MLPFSFAMYTKDAEQDFVKNIKLFIEYQFYKYYHTLVMNVRLGAGSLISYKYKNYI